MTLLEVDNGQMQHDFSYYHIAPFSIQIILPDTTIFEYVNKHKNSVLFTYIYIWIFKLLYKERIG
jgi:hypothetical protein